MLELDIRLLWDCGNGNADSGSDTGTDSGRSVSLGLGAKVITDQFIDTLCQPLLKTSAVETSTPGEV